MKTAFEKYTAKVMHWLKKYGVDTSKNLNAIMNLITDYFSNDSSTVSPDYAAQCIKFEIGRGIGNYKFHGIRESVESDADFVDGVLDELFDMGEDGPYNYYRNHREQIKQFIEDGADPISVAKELANLYSANEGFLEDEEEARQEFEYECGKPEDPEPDENFDKLRKLHHCGTELLGQPTSADGVAATPRDPIAYAISKNDIETLEDYYENGIPLSKITGDSDDTERIPWDKQYVDEFGGDNYRLLTCEGHNINSALEFMLEHTPDLDTENEEDYVWFPIPVFDLYNLFVSKNSSDETIYKLLWHYYHYCGENENSELSYFDMPLKSLLKYYEY